MKNAIISVTDKSGLSDFARGLCELGYVLYATGGTQRFLDGEGVASKPVEGITRFPQMMEGRVKTLHPKIFGGVLARREHPGDMADAAKHEMVMFDLVVVNLYAFEKHLGKPAVDQSAFIDIGGPSLIRAAAKNCVSVCVVTDPLDYPTVLSQIRSGAVSDSLRRTLAAKAFALTSRYDALIASEWQTETVSFPVSEPVRLRYGENPHQQGWFARGIKGDRWQLLQGKELSYNNLLDADSAYRLVCDLSRPAVAIIKHTNPCGVAAGQAPLSELFRKALAGDAQSAFGGIVGINQTVDASVALEVKNVFLEVLIAPQFDEKARAVLGAKKNLRLIEWPNPIWPNCDVRGVMGGLLSQQTDASLGLENLTTVTTLPIPQGCSEDLKFAWTVAKHAKSNAIVLARDGMTLGVGAGQMSRIDSVELALKKSQGKRIEGAVLASDAFFPFRDNIERLRGLRVAAIIQPGGSLRDAEVISACNEMGIAMVFTGQRHFKH